jgi:hypothetical protein
LPWADHGVVLILGENLPSPIDHRVCPPGSGCERKFEAIDGIHIYRYNLPIEAASAAGYALEYAVALAWSFVLA